MRKIIGLIMATALAFNLASPAQSSADVVKLYGVWEVNRYTIEYWSNGEKKGESNLRYDEESALKNRESLSIEKTGHTFLGWSRSVGGEKEFSDADVVSKLDATNGATVRLYAVWSKNSSGLTVYPEGGDWSWNGTVSNDTVTVKKGYGDTVTIDDPERKGYTFVNWSKSDPFNGTLDGKNYTFGPSKDAADAITAQWKANTYTIELQNSDGAVVDTVEATWDQSVQLKSVAELDVNKLGYRFGSWSTKIKGVQTYFDDGATVSNLEASNGGKVILNGSSIELPDGCVNTNRMFYGCQLPKDFSLGEKFDTSKVENMKSMFMECMIPEGFTLGDKFDTSNVECMSEMFCDYKLPEGFTLGEKFNTGCVTDMSSLFFNCEIPEGFTLGDKFDTSKVKNMRNMFFKCKMPEGFTLGDKFDTSNVECMLNMFCGCRMLEGFTLGDKFDTSKVKNMRNMFFKCRMPEGFTLGDKFDTSRVEDMSYMLYDCELPKGFSLGDKFDISNVKNMSGMFERCELPIGFSFGDKFDTSGIEDTDGMFSECRLSKGFTPDDSLDLSKFKELAQLLGKGV